MEEWGIKGTRGDVLSLLKSLLLYIRLLLYNLESYVHMHIHSILPLFGVPYYKTDSTILSHVRI